MQDDRDVANARSSLNHKLLSGASRDHQRKFSSLLMQAELRNRFLQDRVEKLEKNNAALRRHQAALTVCLLLFFCLPGLTYSFPRVHFMRCTLTDGRYAAESASQAVTSKTLHHGAQINIMVHHGRFSVHQRPIVNRTLSRQTTAQLTSLSLWLPPARMQLSRFFLAKRQSRMQLPVFILLRIHVKVLCMI